MDFSWSGYAAAELTENPCLFGTSKGFHFNSLYQVEKSKEINIVTDFFHNFFFFFLFLALYILCKFIFLIKKCIGRLQLYIRHKHNLKKGYM